LLILNKDTDDSSSEEENSVSDDAGNTYYEIKNVAEEQEPDHSTDTDTDGEEEPNEHTEEEPEEESNEFDEDMDDDYKGFALLQGKPGILGSWMLLDSQSTIDMFSKKKLLTNNRDSKQTLTLYCNAGRAIVLRKGI